MSWRLELLILSLLLGTMPAGICNAQKVPVIFEEDDGSVVTVGRTDDRVVGRADGNCIGGGCIDSDRPVGMARPSEIPYDHNRTDGSVSERYSYENVREFLRSGSGPSGTGWEYSMGASISDVPRGVPILEFHHYIIAFYSDATFLPKSVWRNIFRSHTRMSEKVEARQFVQEAALDQPSALPTWSQLYADVAREYDEAFTHPNLSNREQQKLEQARKAEANIISTYRQSFDELDNNTSGSVERAKTALEEHFENVAEDAVSGAETIRGGAGQMLQTLGRYEGTREKIPIKFNELLFSRLTVKAKEYAFIFDNSPEMLRRYAGVVPPIGREPSALRDTLHTRARLKYSVPTSYQGVLARKLAELHLVMADNYARTQDMSLARRANEHAMLFLDIVLGWMPVAGEIRDIYEAYTGEDLMTGALLSDRDRALRVLQVSAFRAVLRDRNAIAETKRSIQGYDPDRSKGAFDQVDQIISASAEKGLDWRVITHKLSSATRQSANYRKNMTNGFNYKLGEGTRGESEVLGAAWVGEGAAKVTTRAGDVVQVSRDGLTQYRPPVLKENGRWQSNFQHRTRNGGVWMSNGHFDVIE